MDNIGFAGACFIWAALLWPVVVPTVCLALFKTRLTSRVWFWLASVLIGFALSILIPALLADRLVPHSPTDATAPSGALTLLLYLLIPLVVSGFFLRSFWRKREGDGDDRT